MADILPISNDEHIKLVEHINSLSMKESYKKEIVLLATLLRTTGLRKKEVFMLNSKHVHEALSSKEFSLDTGRAVVVISLTNEDHSELAEVFDGFVLDSSAEISLFNYKEDLLMKKLAFHMKKCLGKWFSTYSYRLAYKSR